MDDMKVNEPGKVKLRYIHLMLCFSEGHGQTPTRLASVTTHLPRPTCSCQPHPSTEQSCT